MKPKKRRTITRYTGIKQYPATGDDEPIPLGELIAAMTGCMEFEEETIEVEEEPPNGPCTTN